eukprot:TRINITY_DN16266_c0_g1_i1.p1 TRINITY_DN16266_c0_g1~~TRINITY_DN16266_c0_g1_i1.p1  ORF type:complete len:205 (+),score=25.69 TRINITY_DN16266_c0_g1_i1:44-616(+)
MAEFAECPACSAPLPAANITLHLLRCTQGPGTLRRSAIRAIPVDPASALSLDVLVRVADFVMAPRPLRLVSRLWAEAVSHRLRLRPQLKQLTSQDKREHCLTPASSTLTRADSMVARRHGGCPAGHASYDSRAHQSLTTAMRRPSDGSGTVTRLSGEGNVETVWPHFCVFHNGCPVQNSSISQHLVLHFD